MKEFLKICFDETCNASRRILQLIKEFLPTRQRLSENALHLFPKVPLNFLMIIFNLKIVWLCFEIFNHNINKPAIML